MSEITEENRQRGFVSLDSCIRNAIMDIGAGMERYEQFKKWAIDGYREFHFDLAAEVKTVQLELTAWKAIELPIDYVDFVMIGVVTDGDIRVFTNDDRISLYHEDEDPIDGDPDDAPADGSLPTDTTSERRYFYNITSRGEDAGQLYGLTVKSNGVGYYKMNPERREIQFSPHVRSDTLIYLEYISDGINPCEKTVVNVYAAKLIELYIHWQRHSFAKSSNMAEKKEAKDNYWNQYYKVQNRLQKITAADVLEVARDGYRLVQSF